MRLGAQGQTATVRAVDPGTELSVVLPQPISSRRKVNQSRCAAEGSSMNTSWAGALAKRGSFSKAGTLVWLLTTAAERGTCQRLFRRLRFVNRLEHEA